MIENEKTIVREGWGPTNGRKWHYFQFREGQGMTESICGKIGFYSAIELLEQGNDDSNDNCAECKKEIIIGKGNESDNKYIGNGNWICKGCYEERFYAVVCQTCGYRNIRDKYYDEFQVGKYINCEKCNKKLFNPKF